MIRTLYWTIKCHSYNCNSKFNCVFVIDNYIYVWLVGFDTLPKFTNKCVCWSVRPVMPALHLQVEIADLQANNVS